MATIVLPQPPEPLRTKPLPEGLRATTLARLQQRGRHLRAADIPAVPFVITKWDATIHGPRFLWFWYLVVYQAQEHAAVWGALGLEPFQFLAAYAQTEIYVLHRQHAPWTLGDGLMMVVWLDDVMPGAHARIHAWVHPHYRHPSFTDPMGLLVLDHIFATGGYQVLDTRTPATNKAARRWATRLGFSTPVRLPNAEWAYTPTGARQLVDLLYSYMRRPTWHAEAAAPSVDATPVHIPTAWPADPFPPIPEDSPATVLSAQHGEVREDMLSSAPIP